MVLLVAALVILGPERLPGAVRWTTQSLRQVRDYASGATQQLKDDLGPEYDEIRKPLAQLNQLRGMTPRAAITKHILDGDDSIFTGNFDKPASLPPAVPADPPRRLPKPLLPGDAPPIDTDAT